LFPDSRPKQGQETVFEPFHIDLGMGALQTPFAGSFEVGRDSKGR